MAAEPKGKALNIDKWLEDLPKNRIKRCGVEIEGAWVKVPVGTKIDRDGSVFKAMGDEGGLLRSKMPGMKVGEIPLGPMQPAQMPKAIKKFWPSQFDESCGLHAHMSFMTTLQYDLLADSQDYQETICEYLRRWGTEEKLAKDHLLWDRLEGKSKYCQKKFWPDLQIQQVQKDHDQERQGHRYTQVHYCWQRTNSVEVRVLPMLESPEQAIRAIRRVFDITNAYLLVTEKAKKVHGVIDIPFEAGRTRINLELKNGKVYEEYYED